MICQLVQQCVAAMCRMVTCYGTYCSNSLDQLHTVSARKAIGFAMQQHDKPWAMSQDSSSSKINKPHAQILISICETLSVHVISCLQFLL